MKPELIDKERKAMIVLDVHLDNFYAFRHFHMNMTYPKKIVDSSIPEEHMANRPNFRYKKVNVIMGANASGKTSLGRMLMNIFNFMAKMNLGVLMDAIDDHNKSAFFALDLASEEYKLYRVACTIPPMDGKTYNPSNVELEIRVGDIRPRDSYETCVARMMAAPYTPAGGFLEELKRIDLLDWMFEYPQDGKRVLRLPNQDKIFCLVLEHLLKVLDPSIQKVVLSQDVNNAYVVHFSNRSVVLQNGENFDTNLLSSGTKEGVEVACILSALLQRRYSFYYCDEKFSYVHSEVEKAVLSLMIHRLSPNQQLFFTSHNTDILTMDLPKHTFTFLRKNADNLECPITCIDASSLLKRSTDSLKNAVENDLFSALPSVAPIYEIAYI